MKIILTAFGGRLTGEAYISELKPTIYMAMDVPMPRVMAIEIDPSITTSKKAEFEMISRVKFDPDTGRPIHVYRMVSVS